MRERSHLDDMRAAVRGDIERFRARQRSTGAAGTVFDREQAADPARAVEAEPEQASVPDHVAEPEPVPEAVSEPEPATEPVEPVTTPEPVQPVEPDPEARQQQEERADAPPGPSLLLPAGPEDVREALVEPEPPAAFEPEPMPEPEPLPEPEAAAFEPEPVREPEALPIHGPEPPRVPHGFFRWLFRRRDG